MYEFHPSVQKCIKTKLNFSNTKLHNKRKQIYFKRYLDTPVVREVMERRKEKMKKSNCSSLLAKLINERETYH